MHCPRARACAGCGSPATRAARTPSGEYREKPNYFDVSVYGASADSVSRYTHKGSRVAYRRPAGVARVGDLRPAEAPGGEHRRRHRAVPGQLRRSSAASRARTVASTLIADRAESTTRTTTRTAAAVSWPASARNRRTAARVLRTAVNRPDRQRGVLISRPSLFGRAGLFACLTRKLARRGRHGGSRVINRPRQEPVRCQSTPKRSARQYEPTLYAVGREKIKEYARAVGETNPCISTCEAARAAGYADVVAPPMFAVVYSAPVGGTADLRSRDRDRTSR